MMRMILVLTLSALVVAALAGMSGFADKPADIVVAGGQFGSGATRSSPP